MSVAALLTPLLVYFAHWVKLVDAPDARKIHTTPIPRIGGVAILVGTAGGIVAAILLSPGADFWPQRARFAALGLGAAAVFLVGFLDDLWGLSAKLKLASLIGAALLLCQSGIRLEVLSLGSLGTLHLGAFAWPVTILWVVGVSVAINFIDGLDGLAGGISAVACGALTLVAATTGQPLLVIVCMGLLASLTAFLFFNMHPARIFMGDGGSMFLGFSIAGASVMATAKAPVMGLALPAVALGIPLLDAVLTFVRRGVVERRSIFAAERGHIHHRLMDAGIPHRHAVLVLHGVTLVGTLIASALFLFASPAVAGVMTLVIIALLLGLFHFAGCLNLSQVLAAVRRNRAMSRDQRRCRIDFEASQLRLRNAQSFDEWWKALGDAAGLLGFASLTLRASDRTGGIQLHRWISRIVGSAPAQTLCAEIPVPQRRAAGVARALIEVPAAGALESAAVRIKLFSRLIDEHNLASIAGGQGSRDAAGSPAAANRVRPKPLRLRDVLAAGEPIEQLG